MMTAVGERAGEVSRGSRIAKEGGQEPTSSHVVGKVDPLRKLRADDGEEDGALHGIKGQLEES